MRNVQDVGRGWGTPRGYRGFRARARSNSARVKPRSAARPSAGERRRARATPAIGRPSARQRLPLSASARVTPPTWARAARRRTKSARSRSSRKIAPRSIPRAMPWCKTPGESSRGPCGLARASGPGRRLSTKTLHNRATSPTPSQVQDVDYVSSPRGKASRTCCSSPGPLSPSCQGSPNNGSHPVVADLAT